MGLILKCAFMIVFFMQFQSVQLNNITSDGIKCFKETNGTKDHCTGRYCYKQHTLDEETGEMKVKRGCLKAADAQTAVGKCKENILKNTDTVEHFCVCNTELCNSSTQPMTILNMVTLLTVTMVTLHWFHN